MKASIIVLFLFVFDSGAMAQKHESLNSIAERAYTYMLPLVLMDITKNIFTTSHKNLTLNTLYHNRTFDRAMSRQIVRPSFDSLFSVAWIDVKNEPVVLEIPDSKERYYLVSTMDMWTDNFAAPGWRSTGTKKQKILYTSANWKGTIPADMIQIKCPTSMVLMTVRAMTQRGKDDAQVAKFQDRFKLGSLSDWKLKKKLKGKVNKISKYELSAKKTVIKMTAKKFFTYASDLMLKYSPHLSDGNILMSMRKLGIIAGKRLNYDSLSSMQRAALDRSPVAALKDLKDRDDLLGKVTNGWRLITRNVGVHGNQYGIRALISLIGLGANEPMDTLYPMTNIDRKGDRLKAIYAYKMHFDKDGLPPVDAFWSLTIYDDSGFPMPNKRNRRTISSWMPLNYNPDGSLDIIFSHDVPQKSMRKNWYPLPSFGVFNITMRMHAPHLKFVQEEAWSPPAVTRYTLTR